MIDEVKAEVPARRPVLDELRQYWLRRGGVDHGVVLHAAQHVGKALARTLRVVVGIEVVRSLGEPGEQRALDCGERLGWFAEIAARRHLNAPGPTTEINRVEIELEDFRLGQGALHPRGNDHFAQFSFVGDVVAHQQVLGDLLCNGRAALRSSRVREVADEGADQSALVNAGVLEEALVLGGDKCVAHRFRDIGKLDPDAAIVRHVNLSKALALAVEDYAGARKPEVLKLHGVGQILDRAVVESDDLTKIDRRFFHFVDLAELPVGHVEVGQLQSFECLDLAAQCLLVIHGSGNQIVQVDVLNVESLAHVGAAGTQKLRHLGAVTYRIKLRLDPIRPGGDLAEGKRRGEDLDENRVHNLPPVKKPPRKVPSCRTILNKAVSRKKFPRRPPPLPRPSAPLRPGRASEPTLRSVRFGNTALAAHS